MAYKYSRKNLPTISGAAGDAYTADPIGDLNRANEIAEKELRKSDISQRAEMLKSVSGYGDTSYDQEFNDKTDALLLHYADEYAKVTDGLNRGNIDVGEGTAYKQQLMDKLDVYQKFVIASKTVEDVMAKAEGIQKGGVGSLIVGGGINDLEAAEMIHNLWNNPENLEIGGDADGRGMYLKNTKTGKVINMTEFNQMVGDGKSFLEEIPDFKTNTKTAIDTILANPNIGEFKYEQTYTNANGSQSKRDMYNVAILRDEFAKADPWSAILTSSTEANAAWEWLNGMNQKDKTTGKFRFEGLEGEWYGNEMKTDGSGEYTDRANKQRAALKDALTQYTINTNIPKHQNDEFNVLRSRSLKEKTPEKPTGPGGLGDKNSADYTELININDSWKEADRLLRNPGVPSPEVGLKNRQKAVDKSILDMEKYLTNKYRNRSYNGKDIVDFKVEMVDPNDPKKGLHFKPKYKVEVPVTSGVNDNGKPIPVLNEDGSPKMKYATGKPIPVLNEDGSPKMKYATKFASEWFDVYNMDQLTTFENNLKKQGQDVTNVGTPALEQNEYLKMLGIPTN